MQAGSRYDSLILQAASTNRRVPRILVVEPDLDSAAHIERALVGRYQIEFEADAVVALRRCTDSPPDLVIASYHLAEIDCETFHKVLRGSSLRQAIRFLVLTTRDMPRRGRATVDGDFRADEYLAKPFRTAALQNRVHLLLQRLSLFDSSAVRRIDQFTLHLRKHQVHVAGKSLGLSIDEFRLFNALTQRPAKRFELTELRQVLADDDGPAGAAYVRQTLRILRVNLGAARTRIQFHLGALSYRQVGTSIVS